MKLNHVQNRAKRVLFSSLTLIAGAMYQSCGGYGVSDIYDYTYGYYDIPWDYSVGYGPIDQDVFDSAADAWDDYIRM